LVLRGGWSTFSNGIHLGVIQASAQAATEAWANVVAITAICKEIITCGRQVTIGTYTGNAGAGGVMLALGADVVAGRDGVVLNPYYDMGLFGSGLHSYTLPRRVGAGTAERLLTERLPVSIGHAAGLGLVDAIGPRSPKAFTSWLAEFAERYAERGLWREMLDAKRRILERDAVRMPLEAYQAAELGEMTRDIFGDRSGFATARAAFVYKQRSPAGRPYLTSQVA
jgi:putative two-component system hydrogenase maturation factor HypX/HoxX